MAPGPDQVGLERLAALGILGRQAQVELAAAGRRKAQRPLQLAAPAGHGHGAGGEHQLLSWRVVLADALPAKALARVLAVELQVLAGEGRRQQRRPPTQVAQGEAALAARPLCPHPSGSRRLPGDGRGAGSPVPCAVLFNGRLASQGIAAPFAA